MKYCAKFLSISVDIEGGGSQQLYHHDCWRQIPGYTTREPQQGFELETNSFQFYSIANLEKTSD